MQFQCYMQATTACIVLDDSAERQALPQAGASTHSVCSSCVVQQPAAVLDQAWLKADHHSCCLGLLLGWVASSQYVVYAEQRQCCTRSQSNAGRNHCHLLLHLLPHHVPHAGRAACTGMDSEQERHLGFIGHVRTGQGRAEQQVVHVVMNCTLVQMPGMPFQLHTCAALHDHAVRRDCCHGHPSRSLSRASTCMLGG